MSKSVIPLIHTQRSKAKWLLQLTYINTAKITHAKNTFSHIITKSSKAEEKKNLLYIATKPAAIIKNIIKNQKQFTLSTVIKK